LFRKERRGHREKTGDSVILPPFGSHRIVGEARLEFGRKAEYSSKV
jgi:hypothetical protein